MAEAKTKTTTTKTAAQSNVNTSASVKEGGRKQVTQADIDRSIKRAGKALSEKKQVEVTIPKYLEKRLGKVLPVGINGAVIYIPVGEKVKVPEPYKAIIDSSLNNLRL